MLLDSSDIVKCMFAERQKQLLWSKRPSRTGAISVVYLWAERLAAGPSA
jgi:hypothetical protein